MKTKDKPVEFEREARVAMSGLHTTMTRAQYRETLRRYGEWFFYNGVRRYFKAKHLGVGVWEVWSEARP